MLHRLAFQAVTVWMALLQSQNLQWKLLQYLALAPLGDENRKGMETSRVTSCLNLNISIDMSCVPNDKLIHFACFSVLIDFVEV